MSSAIQILIAHRLGQQFIESPQFDLRSSFDDSTVTTPLIFVLSVEADSATDLLRFAEKRISQRNCHQCHLVRVKEKKLKNE
jgi:dynein heavy chain